MRTHPPNGKNEKFWAKLFSQRLGKKDINLLEEKAKSAGVTNIPSAKLMPTHFKICPKFGFCRNRNTPFLLFKT